MAVAVLDNLAGALGGVRRLLQGQDRRVVLGVIAGVLATLLGTAVLIAAFLWPSGPPAPAAEPPLPAASLPATAGHGGASAQQQMTSASPTASAATSTRPATPGTSAASASRSTAPVPLTARFAKGAGGGLAGYPATVTVTNPGPAATTGWTVTLTLPRNTLEVTDVSGATVTRDGAVWTFIPTAATAQVGASKSVTVSFRVGGATLLDATPTACTVDGNPCQGVG